MYSREGLYDGQIEMVDEVSTLKNMIEFLDFYFSRDHK